MPPQRFPPESPQECINRAHSDLSISRMQGQDIYLEDLCFHTQQAVEKAVKALLIAQDIEFPYTHDITRLMTMLEEAGTTIPDEILEGERLTRFAVATRYPGVLWEITFDEYEESIQIAEAVIGWAENLINDQTTMP